MKEVWHIVDPVLHADTAVYEYEPKTWGPREVEQKVSPVGGWQNSTMMASGQWSVENLLH